MGINRGPSLGFAILLHWGWDPNEAITAIRDARPIANVWYAVDALVAGAGIPGRLPVRKATCQVSSSRPTRAMMPEALARQVSGGNRISMTAS